MATNTETNTEDIILVQREEGTTPQVTPVVNTVNPEEYGAVRFTGNPATQRARNWIFTLNNYADSDVTRLAALVPSKAAYVIYGREVGESGTPHFQGYVSWVRREPFNNVRKMLGGRAHIEVAKFVAKAIEYCKKEGDVTEHGEPKVKKSGQRSDLEDFKDAVKKGETNCKVLREEHSDVFAKYQGFCVQYIIDNAPSIIPDLHVLSEWQQKLNGILNLEADRRKIYFVVDEVGNSGKSWFAKYYEWQHPEDTQVIQPGKRTDMAYMLEMTSRVIFLDCPRAKQGDFIQYDILEQIKDGTVSSYKYQCVNKKFAKKVHVVVLMNQEPDMTKLSADRYEIIHAQKPE